MRAGDGAVAVTVTADAVALAVALTTQAAGYFSPNYFLARLDEGGKVISRQSALLCMDNPLMKKSRL